MNIKETIKAMTLQEKVAMLSGDGAWHTKSNSRLGINGVMMTDGPHGLRKIEDEHLMDMYTSVRSTCFPTASMTACSWDEELLEEIGGAIGEEALQEGVSVVLGPGANIKRSPLCGRNFEYFSEDPWLAGKMAAAWIRGVEGKGVGTSLKHFAANNQENMRMSISAEIDKRTLREIYLKPFEIAVKEGKPSTVMCAYNKINGTYLASNKEILRDILRNEWGFEGLIMSDWGAVDDRVASVKAGLDLEMPDSGGFYDQDVIEAVERGELDESLVDECVERVLRLSQKGADRAKPGYKYDAESHDSIAERAALESAVLLKNEGALPLDKSQKTLIIGAFANESRFQGGGSSHINSRKVVTLLEGLEQIGAQHKFAPVYSLIDEKYSQSAMNDALALGSDCDKIVVCIGLTDEYETEGMDRKHMELPSSQLKTLEAAIATKKPIVAVYYGGSPVEIEDEKINAVLAMYLSGEMGGSACAKLLYGDANPCGKLAETFPIKLEDTSCYQNFNTNMQYAVYIEGQYVQYRYYDSINRRVHYPFGHGLSYTTFKYSDCACDKAVLTSGDSVNVCCNVKNIGTCDGKEIVQVYMRKVGGAVFTPYQELKGFKKITLKSGEERAVAINVTADDLRYYDAEQECWRLECGEYELAVGASSRDIKCILSITVEGEIIEDVNRQESWYTAPTCKAVPMDDFNALRGYDINIKEKIVTKGEFTADNALCDMMPESFLARTIMRIASLVVRMSLKTNKKDTAYIMTIETLRTSPIKRMAASSQGVFNRGMLDGVLIMLNGKFCKGLRIVLKNRKKSNKTD